MYVFRKCSILLLEVLIAFALVVLTILPLLFANMFMLAHQKKFMHKIELDHLVNLAFVGILEKMYNQELTLSQVLSEQNFEIDQRAYREIDLPLLPYRGFYHFHVKDKKPKSPKAFLLDLTFEFFHIKDKDAEGEPLKLKYDYLVFALKNFEDTDAIAQSRVGNDDEQADDDDDDTD